MLATAPSALACSCVEDPDAKETLHGFDAAATARLVDVKKDDNPNSGDVKLVYRVLRVYKGSNLQRGRGASSSRTTGSTRARSRATRGARYGLRLNRFRGELDRELLRSPQSEASFAGPLTERQRLAHRGHRLRDSELNASEEAALRGSRGTAAALVIGGIVSVQVGAAIATTLFDEVGPGGAVFLRIFFAAIVLMAIWRPALRMPEAGAKDVLALGLILGLMNLCSTRRSTGSRSGSR